MPLSDEKCLKLALISKNHDKIAKEFETIYNQYSKLVSFCIGKFIDNNETIKDLTNDVFLSFFQNANNVKGSIKSYLCKCAKNKAIDYLKSKKDYIDIDSINTLSINSASFYYNLFEDLKRILSKEEIAIIEYHIVYGYSFKEIGKILNISSSNANVIYFRALKKCQKI